MRLMKKYSSDRPAFKIDGGYRSGLEEQIAKQLEDLKVAYEYEKERIAYQRTCHYLPDFKLPNGIYIEAKGQFTSEDRGKLRKVKKQHPDKDIRLVFSRSKSKLNKGSPTTYADWCEKYGFPYADKQIPEEWIKE
jgi:hypothetical protein